MQDNKVNVKEVLQKRCNRWVQEGKLEALRTLANVCERLRREIFDVNFVYSSIMKTYSLKNDYKGALEFYEQLLEKDLIIDKELEIQLQRLKNSNVQKIVNDVQS